MNALVTFRVGDTDWAVDVDTVLEVTTASSVTPVPGTARRVLGVTSWRGRTLPVLRLAEDLKDCGSAPDQRCRLLVLRWPGPFALRVDSPGQIVRTWEPLERESLPGETEVLELVRVDGRLVRVLDVPRVVADPRALLDNTGGGACARTA
ncbi:MAG: chemotaxis protein CheW [bacterium]